MSASLESPLISKLIFCSYMNSAMSIMNGFMSCRQYCFLSRQLEQNSRSLHCGCLQKQSISLDGCLLQDTRCGRMYACSFSYSLLSFMVSFIYLYGIQKIPIKLSVNNFIQQRSWLEVVLLGCNLLITLIIITRFSFCFMSQDERVINCKQSCVGDSGVTSATVQAKIQRKISTLSCKSGLSVDQAQHKNEAFLQRKLMMKFLCLRRSRAKVQKILVQMKTFYSTAETQAQVSSPLGQTLKHYIASSKSSPSHEDEMMMVYFVTLWLKDMGYGSEQNKARLVERARLGVPAEKIPQALKFYQTLGLETVDREKRLEHVLEICENGWEWLFHLLDKAVAANRQL